MNKHFSFFNHNLYSCSLSSAFLRASRCNSSLCPVIRILSIYIVIPGSPWGIFSTVCWRIVGAEAIPNGNQLYQYNPLWGLIVTNWPESSSKRTCWWPSDKSTLVNFCPPARFAKRSSAFGWGYWSTWRMGWWWPCNYHIYVLSYLAWRRLLLVQFNHCNLFSQSLPNSQITLNLSQ